MKPPPPPPPPRPPSSIPLPPPPPPSLLTESTKSALLSTLSQYSIDEYFDEFQANLNAQPVDEGPKQPIKKTPFQLKKEAEEAKKKQNEEDAARALEEFTASFETDTIAFGHRSIVAKTWVKGGAVQKNNSEIVQLDSSGAKEKDDDEGDSFYRPHLKLKDQFGSSASKPPIQPPSSSTTTGKKRQLDAFLQELKQHHEESPSQRQRISHSSENLPSSSFTSNMDRANDPDSISCNLFLGNLHPSTTEHTLLEQFGVYGPIASVKIMWPRSREEMERGRNSAFVGFMTRRDAEDALLDVQAGKVVDGRKLHVGWSKPMVIPAQPIYVGSKNEVQTSALGSATTEPISDGPHPFSAKRNPLNGNRLEIQVQVPSNRETLFRIHRTIEFVILHGPTFEAAVMGKERNNPGFSFLFDHSSPDHVYYRWKLFSLLHGDAKRSGWNEEPFVMFEESGIYWIPPRLAFEEEADDQDSKNNNETDTDDSSDSDAEEAPRRKKKKQPTFQPRHLTRLHTRLRNLSLPSRTQIASLMLFTMRHAPQNHTLLAQTISESMTHYATPLLPHKLSRLYLVSDILHNCASVQGGWKLRAALCDRLPKVFEHFGDCWKGIEARLRAEQWKRGVLGVVGVWERWSLFEPGVLEALRKGFEDGCLGVVDVSRGKEVKEESGDEEDVDGVPMSGTSTVEVEVSVATGFKPIGTVEPAKKPRVSRFDRVDEPGIRGVGLSPTASKFVPATSTTSGFVPAASSNASKSLAGFVAATPASVPLSRPVPSDISTVPPPVKKTTRVVAGAASVFQDDDDDD
ncbi:hypothetical protein BCR33DRAFT_714725 [Rhizoclosmatium globosum]|uniref:Uncharacterized protein n=1 Tax=Rhizoclosmatium globosum TaxID=329046 RepID=A0A1Y2CKS9_9FUNG|nr:hypothetical protein BCR33DRAFT_714725 [Rhizoclosmatium globosum]|eukprot:ORY47623.1 hypothetical protein BCR33DRAFT_714725 [Rhizoclosmatium globosum]